MFRETKRQHQATSDHVQQQSTSGNSDLFRLCFIKVFEINIFFVRNFSEMRSKVWNEIKMRPDIKRPRLFVRGDAV